MVKYRDCAAYSTPWGQRCSGACNTISPNFPGLSGNRVADVFLHLLPVLPELDVRKDQQKNLEVVELELSILRLGSIDLLVCLFGILVLEDNTNHCSASPSSSLPSSTCTTFGEIVCNLCSCPGGSRLPAQLSTC